jgi:hypothetical protein
MITNIDIDEQLVADAMKLSGARTKREVVDRALREMVARARRPRVKDLFGIAKPGDFWPGYDPKAEPHEAGKYKVEQVLAPYAAAPAKKAARKRRKA